MLSLEKQTLGELCLKAAERYRKKICFQMYRDGGVYNRISYGELGLRAKGFARMLMRLGVRPGDRVMLIAENRPEWPLAYFGIALAGGIAVPVLADFSAEQTEAIASHAGISALCHTEKTAAKIRGISSAIPAVEIDRERPEREAAVFPRGDEFPEVNEDDPAAVLYTSGTTESSKGVLLSHRNLVFTAAASRSLMKIFSRDRLLSVIPLAHTYECSLGMLTAVMNGASVSYLDRPPSPAVLLPAAQILRPTAIVSVPLFIEKICGNKIFPAMKKSPLYRFPLTRILAIRLAGQKLMAGLGSSLRFFGIGGAPLSEEVECFLRQAGFPYSTGYGLTETAPLAAGSAPYKFPRRSSGRALKGAELRIGGEGEIEVRGPNVMLGYYRDEARTKQAFTKDGWFKTGDLGRLDKKGRLFIQGRLKNLILGPSGENIYPEEIESMLNTSLLVEDSLVVSGKKGELVALIVLSEKAKNMIAALGNSLEELKTGVNKKLAAFSRLSRIEIQREPFEKTPTRKIKRFLYAGST